MRYLTLAMAATVVTSTAAGAQTWRRQAEVSPDGSLIAFAQDGDIWIVASEGGQARPLTTHGAYDTMPVWSRDGSQIAFASDRHGNYDVFIAPAAGGPAERITHYSSSDQPSDILGDGRVLFSSSRVDDPSNAQFPSGVLPELYAAHPEGGMPTRLLTTPAIDAVADDNGTRILYHDQKGYEDDLRKHHRSAIARDVWLYDVEANSHRQLTTFEGEDREPVFDPEGGGFYFLSERAGSSNVFRASFDDPEGAEQITFFDMHPVRDLSVDANGALVFTHHGVIHRKVQGDDPVAVEINAAVDGDETAAVPTPVSGGVTEMALSPDGQEIAFVHRGEVFVTSVDYSSTKRITDTPEQERSVSFSPDGRSLVYAGERGDSWNLYETSLDDEDENHFFRATKISEREVIATDAEEFQPAYSPDGEKIAYLHDRNEIRVLDRESGESRTALAASYNASYSDGDIRFAWSPDSQWISSDYAARRRWRTNIGVFPADGSAEPVDISLSGYSEFAPQWVIDGSAVMWVSNRYGERSHGSWGSEVDVMAAFLTQDAYDRFNLSKEDYEALKAAEEEAEESEDADNGDGSEEEEAVEPIEIEWNRVHDRTERLTIHSSSLAGAALSPKGDKLYYLAEFEEGYDLWVHDFRERETKLLSKLGASSGMPLAITLNKDGDTAFVLANGGIRKIGLDGGDASPIAISGMMMVRAAQEREYMFEHIWRQVREKFYVDDLHGVDWDGLKREYAAVLPGIGNNHDFAIAMSEMLGELNASHTGAFYRPSREGADETASLAAFYDNNFDGAGVRILDVIPGGPLARADVNAEPGTVIEAIDGVAIGDNANFYALLNHRAGELTRLTLRGPGRRAESRDVTLRPVSLREESQLRYERWVDERRAIVEEASGGRLGYTHIRGMNDSSFRQAFHDIFGRNIGKEGLVVDTRFNGGGWLHDDLAVLLSGERYMDFVPRGQELRGEPEERWQKPSILVVSESNYSDAHMFPYAYRVLGLGEIVGMPVPGTGTAVWWEQLHTGDIVFGIPQVGMRGLDGEFLENNQLEPDIEVNLDPESAAAGVDTQLQAAVDRLLETIDG